MGRRTSRAPDAHSLVRGFVDGWFVCTCGCGYVAVCRHCLPDGSAGVDEALCDAEQRRLKVGKYAEDVGRGNA